MCLLGAENAEFSPPCRACLPHEKHILANRLKIKQFLAIKLTNKFSQLQATPWQANSRRRAGSKKIAATPINSSIFSNKNSMGN